MSNELYQGDYSRREGAGKGGDTRLYLLRLKLPGESVAGSAGEQPAWDTRAALYGGR
jgi:hypothetical protein